MYDGVPSAWPVRVSLEPVATSLASPKSARKARAGPGAPPRTSGPSSISALSAPTNPCYPRVRAARAPPPRAAHRVASPDDAARDPDTLVVVQGADARTLDLHETTDSISGNVELHVERQITGIRACFEGVLVSPLELLDCRRARRR